MGSSTRGHKEKTLNEKTPLAGSRPSAPSVAPHKPAVVGPWPILGGRVAYNALITLVALEIARASVQREI